MELARLASKQAASKQQASSAGPFLRPGATGVPKLKKKCNHAIRDGFPQLSRGQFFVRLEPHVVGNGDLLGFGPVLGRGHLEKFRAQAKNRKTQFPDARGPKTEKKVSTLFGIVVRNFLTFTVLTDRSPTGGKTRSTRILGHFGLGGPLALREIAGPGRKRKIAISRC